MTLGSEQIIVKLVPTENQIVISDNGIGIPASEVEKALISIGNSKKSSKSSRGFRGIGRFADKHREENIRACHQYCRDT